MWSQVKTNRTLIYSKHLYICKETDLSILAKYNPTKRKQDLNCNHFGSWSLKRCQTSFISNIHSILLNILRPVLFEHSSHLFCKLPSITFKTHFLLYNNKLALLQFSKRWHKGRRGAVCSVWLVIGWYLSVVSSSPIKGSPLFPWARNFTLIA